MNRRISYIVEIMWLVIAIFCLLFGAHKTVQTGLANSYVLFILSAVSFLMYSIRRFLRKSQKNK